MSSSEFFEPIAVSPGHHVPAHDPFTFLGFTLLVLEPGQTKVVTAEDTEQCCVVLTGTLDIAVDDHSFEGVGSRASVFDGAPDSVYVPAGSVLQLRAIDHVEVAICSARVGGSGASGYVPYRVRPEEVHSGQWGAANTERTFDFVIDAERPSQRLFVAEVTVADGRWATYPPHKHERDAPGEVFQEEFYFYRVDPAHGFGFGGLYGGHVGGDHAFIIRDNTLHKIPYGYHTLTAAPGYRVWYLAAFAGESKVAAPAVDPDHQWFAPAPLPDSKTRS